MDDRQSEGHSPTKTQDTMHLGAMAISARAGRLKPDSDRVTFVLRIEARTRQMCVNQSSKTRRTRRDALNFQCVRRVASRRNCAHWRINACASRFRTLVSIVISSVVLFGAHWPQRVPTTKCGLTFEVFVCFHIIQ